MAIRIILIMAMISLSSCLSSKIINSADETRNGIKYGIAYCLSKTYAKTAFSSDSRHISGSYIQTGSYGIQVYESIRGYVDAYQQKKYLSKHNKNLDIMQCIDLLESRELKVIIEQSANK